MCSHLTDDLLPSELLYTTNVKAFIIPCLLPLLFSGPLQGLKQAELTSAVVRFAYALTKTETKRPCFYLLTYLFIYLFIRLLFICLFIYLCIYLCICSFIYLCRAFNIASRARDIIQGNVKSLESRFAAVKLLESRFARASSGWFTSLLGCSLLSLFPPKALDPKDEAKVSQPRSRRCLYACAQLFVCLLVHVSVHELKRACVRLLLIHSACVFP